MRGARRIVPFVVLSTATLGACRANRVETVVGRHTILHWDRDENLLCNGTLAYVDGTFEAVADTYGVALPAEPAIEVFWTDQHSLAAGLCATGSDESWGCTAPFPNGTSFIVLWDVTNPHELTHAVRLSDDAVGMPAFFGEGVAVRWELGPGRWPEEKLGLVGELDVDEIDRLLEQRGLEFGGYFEAGLLWAWLEAEHGGPKMAEFAARLGRFTRADDIRREFERTFGHEIDHAIAQTRGQPPLTFDVPGCTMADLPTQAWTGEPILLSPGPSDCETDDLINTLDLAAHVMRIELPASTAQYRINLTAGDSEYGYVRFEACLGGPRPIAGSHTVSEDGSVVELGGRYVVTTYAEIASDGGVALAEAWLTSP